MKLNDLIDALAAEVELAQPRLNQDLDQLATLDCEDAQFMDVLEQYSSQTQRMGEAADMAGFEGLQAICSHVLVNTLAFPALGAEERATLVAFLRPWPHLIIGYLRNIADRSGAAGLIDHMVQAPYPLDDEQALKIMHMLGALPAQLQLPGGQGGQPRRAVVATDEDVTLQLPGDVDDKLMEGFANEAPDQARHLVALSRKMAAGLGDIADLRTAKRVAHTLKGSGAIIGIRGLATLAHHFEDILEHFESGGTVARSAADALLDAAYCLEQMVGYVIGSDDYPKGARAVLQQVLDLANRIDQGEPLELPLEARAGNGMEPVAPAAPSQSLQPAGTAAATATPTASLRVSAERVDELFRLAGEVSVHSAAMEVRIKAVVDRSRELLAQNLRVQKRLFELETVVDVRALTMARAHTHRVGEAALDPLEMDEYSELHGTAHALMEEAADARALAVRMEDEVAQLGSVQARQQRLAKDLQHLVIGTRMTEAGVLESRLQRNVRSTCQATGKEAALTLRGADTLIDSDVLSSMADPLLHLMRNAVDHGLETPEVRVANGKPRAGRLELAFSRQGQQVVLRCSDDGAGLDLRSVRARAIERGLVAASQVLDDDATARLILLPGFSMRDDVSEISGRGIGLDIVRDWASTMNGSIRILTQPGRGCTFELRFAASLSTVHCLIVEVGGQRFALSSLQVEQAIPRGLGKFMQQGEQLVYRNARRTIPARRLCDLVGMEPGSDRPLDEYDVVIVRHEEQVRALAVERLVDSRELLVKSPGRYARHMRGVAGLSILGDGGLAVNLDLSQLLAAPGTHKRVVDPARSPAAAAPRSRLPQVLIVDDAFSVRNSLLQLVQDAGYQAKAARDGLEAVDALRSFTPDIILTDMEMPNMSGLELTAHIRGREDLRHLPVVMITSRSQDKHRRLASEAGVNTYVTKPYTGDDLLFIIREALATA